MVCSLLQSSWLACLQAFVHVVLYAWNSIYHLTPTVASAISRITPDDPLRKLSTSSGLKDLLFFPLIAFCAFLYHSINHPIWSQSTCLSALLVCENENCSFHFTIYNTMHSTEYIVGIQYMFVNILFCEQNGSFLWMMLALWVERKILFRMS